MPKNYTYQMQDLFRFYKFARQEIAEQRAEYEMECENAYKLGYRPKYCIHGTYMWCDYDVICGHCEAALTDLEWAFANAKRRHIRYMEMYKHLDEIIRVRNNPANSYSVREHLNDAIHQAFTEIQEYFAKYTGKVMEV